MNKYEFFCEFGIGFCIMMSFILKSYLYRLIFLMLTMVLFMEYIYYETAQENLCIPFYRYKKIKYYKNDKR